MKRPGTASALLTVGLVAAGLVSAGPATADHHDMKIVEVFAGTGDFEDAEYVELKMYSAAQQLVGGHHIRVYGPDGALSNTHTFQADAVDSATQGTVLLATQSAESLFNVVDDYGVPASPTTLGLNAAGGKVCFESAEGFGVIDCVAWGSYSGSSTGVGSPFNPGEGIPSGAAIGRNLKGNATLEAGDDTNNSAADFGFITPSPDPNGVALAGAALGGSLRFDVAAMSGPEDVTPLSVDVTRTGGVGSVMVDYASAAHPTTSAPATAGSDYTAVDDTLTFPDTDPQPVDVPLIDDGECERTERFMLRLRNPTGGAVLGSLINKTGDILDDDAPNEGCYVLEDTAYQGNEGGSVVVTIVRTGDLTTSGASVHFKTTAGTASAGEFVAWDDQVPPGGFGNNVGSLEVEVELPEDTKDEPNETFTVTLSNPQPAGAELGTPATATVTIVDDDETQKPASRITKPAHGNTYRRPRLARFVGTASDTGGSGLKLVQVALRRKMTNGSCKWWTGSRWSSRSCTRKLFVKAAGRSSWAYALNNLLPRSRRTTTRNYTLFSRAIDRSANVENRFTRGRNMNTFEIR